MALFLFTKSIIEGNQLRFLTMGNDEDFTYMDDVIESLFNLIHKPAIQKLNPSEQIHPQVVIHIEF